jgi:hypothetical protein
MRLNGLRQFIALVEKERDVAVNAIPVEAYKTCITGKASSHCANGVLFG